MAITDFVTTSEEGIACCCCAAAAAGKTESAANVKSAVQ
jgi:hypothetical protein